MMIIFVTIIGGMGQAGFAVFWGGRVMELAVQSKWSNYVVYIAYIVN